jgi:hypothetical protein
MPKENEEPTEGSRSRNDATGRLFIPDVTSSTAASAGCVLPEIAKS